MKILQSCQKYFSVLGISPNKCNQVTNFSVKCFIWIPGFVLNITSLVIFIFQEGDNFIEYMFSIYMITGTTAVAAGLAAIAFNAKFFFEFIEKSERSFEESKYK